MYYIYRTIRIKHERSENEVERRRRKNKTELKKSLNNATKRNAIRIYTIYMLWRPKIIRILNSQANEWKLRFDIQHSTIEYASNHLLLALLCCCCCILFYEFKFICKWHVKPVPKMYWVRFHYVSLQIRKYPTFAGMKPKQISCNRNEEKCIMYSIFTMIVCILYVRNVPGINGTPKYELKPLFEQFHIIMRFNWIRIVICLICSLCFSIFHRIVLYIFKTCQFLREAFRLHSFGSLTKILIRLHCLCITYYVFDFRRESEQPFRLFAFRNRKYCNGRLALLVAVRHAAAAAVLCLWHNNLDVTRALSNTCTRTHNTHRAPSMYAKWSSLNQKPKTNKFNGKYSKRREVKSK